MSLISKFTQLFTSEDASIKLEKQINAIANAQNQKTLIQSQYLLHQKLKMNPLNFEIFFSSLQSLSPTFKNNQLLNLLQTVHHLLKLNDGNEIARFMRAKPISLTPINESIERLTTEQSTSSIFVLKENNQSQQNVPKSKQEMIMEKRKGKVNVINAEEEIKIQPLKDLKQFVRIYYSYLLKLGSNMELISSVMRGEYPYEVESDPKLKFLWIYKLQNIIQAGMILLSNQKVGAIEEQKLVHFDMSHFMIFINREIGAMIQEYEKMNNIDTLSLFEIYLECQRIDKELQLGSVDVPRLDEFIEFANKLRALSKLNKNKGVRTKEIKLRISNVENASGCPMITFLQGGEKLNELNKNEIEEYVMVEMKVDEQLQFENYPKTYEEEIARKVHEEKINKLVEMNMYSMELE